MRFTLIIFFIFVSYSTWAKLNIPTAVTTLPSKQLEKSKLFSFSITGGTSEDNFIQEGVTEFKDALAPYSENIVALYGGEEAPAQEDKICFKKNILSLEEAKIYGREQEFQKLMDAKEELLAGDVDCETLGEVIYPYMFNEEEAVIRREICQKAPTPDEYANSLNVLAQWDALTGDQSPVKKGDRLYLSLVDHGLQEGPETWAIYLSDSYDSVTNQDMENQIQKVMNKGVKAQYFFDACYSGGFTEKLHQMAKTQKQAHNACGISTSTSSKMGYSEDALIAAPFSSQYNKNLKHYKNPLAAMACSLAQDPVNRAQSTLDLVVKDYLAKKEEQNATEPCDPELEQILGKENSSVVQELGRFLEEKANPKDRQQLLQAYEDRFMRIYNDCDKQDNDAEQVVQKLAQKQCPQNPSAVFLYQDFLKDYEGRSYALKQMMQHQEMLHDENLGQEDFELYRDNFCCLARDLDGQEPEFCP